MEDVPETIIFDILSKLPVKTIMYCKCVCKQWRGLLSSPDFVQSHLSRSPEALLIDKYSTWPGSYEWVEMDHLDSVKSINLNFCPREYTFGILQVGSVNGLICSCSQEYDDIYIFNHVLGEYMLLPEPRLKNLVSLSCGFGVSTAGEYKVIRICGRRTCLNPYRPLAVEIEVYTIGTGEWRLLGQTPYRIQLREGKPGVFVNTHLYWVVDDGRIYDFDLNTETFELFPSPPVPLARVNEDFFGFDLNTMYKHMLGVLKGRLSRVSWCSLGLEVWVMKEKYWCKEIAIQENIIKPKVLPLCLMDGLEGNSILMFHDQSTKELVAYYLNTNTILHLNLRGYFCSIITYRPSFVKLQDFESKRVHAMYKRVVLNRYDQVVQKQNPKTKLKPQSKSMNKH